MVDIDTSTEFGKRVARRLADDRIIWLTTSAANGTPLPSPVWFHWDGDTVLIYSQPNTPKLRNIEARPRVSLNFNTDEHGGDVIILAGDAWIDSEAPPAHNLPAYVEKYGDGIQSLSMTPEQFAGEYSVPVRVRPTSLRGF